MTAIALVVKRVELDLTNAAGQFARGCERSGRERSNDRDIGHVAIAELRNDVATSIDHHRQLRFRFL